MMDDQPPILCRAYVWDREHRNFEFAARRFVGEVGMTWQEPPASIRFLIGFADRAGWHFGHVENIEALSREVRAMMQIAKLGGIANVHFETVTTDEAADAIRAVLDEFPNQSSSADPEAGGDV